MRLSLLAIAAVLALSGCNTYYQNTYEKILVRTPGADNADCDLYTADNRYSVITPRLAVIERTDQPLSVVCRKSGYYPASVIVKPEINGPYVPLNLANGFVPGTLTDIASKSIYDYPETIIVTLLPMPPQQQPVEDSYTTQKKPEQIYKPAPSSDADEALSKSGKK